MPNDPLHDASQAKVFVGRSHYRQAWDDAQKAYATEEALRKATERIVELESALSLATAERDIFDAQVRALREAGLAWRPMSEVKGYAKGLLLYRVKATQHLYIMPAQNASGVWWFDEENANQIDSSFEMLRFAPLPDPAAVLASLAATDMLKPEGAKIQVDINEVRAIQKRRGEINRIPTEKIEWVENGKPVALNPAEVESHLESGLNNVDFVTYFLDGEPDAAEGAEKR